MPSTPFLTPSTPLASRSLCQRLNASVPILLEFHIFRFTLSCWLPCGNMVYRLCHDWHVYQSPVTFTMSAQCMQFTGYWSVINCYTCAVQVHVILQSLHTSLHCDFNCLDTEKKLIINQKLQKFYLSCQLFGGYPVYHDPKGVQLCHWNVASQSKCINVMFKT